ncbi:MAG: GGDEF domain-containing protein [Planctomycetes bacterium]|nr:GGDEF domain-containing protein [Planctomycetota bacterium]
MPDPQVTRTLTLAVPQMVHAVGSVAFVVMSGWALIWARGLSRRRDADPHALFILRLTAAIFALSIAIAVPALFKPPRGGPRELADAVRSAAALGCGVVALFIASARRDSSAFGALRTRVRELERDLGGLVSATGELRQQADTIRNRAEAASTLDAVTGLPSRKLFDDVFARELKRAKRAERPVALALAQVDHLEKYAGAFGRQAADQLMQGIAKIFAGQIRDTDLLVRYAPDRFAILMPETDQEKAVEIGDWIRSMVANSPFAHRAEMPGEKVSISVGVGAFPAPIADIAAFQGMVEAALEKAGAEKNQLKVAT